MLNRQGKRPRNSLTRREVLYQGVALATLALPLAALAQSGPESNAARNLAQFTQLSQTLTGQTNLNPVSAERIFLALGGHHQQFTSALADLASVVDRDPSGWSQEQEALARKILQGWYLGTVGEGDATEVITYEHALMFQPVAEELAPRTFCYRKPGYWATQPGKA